MSDQSTAPAADGAAAPNTQTPVQELEGLVLAYAEGGTKKAKFSYPGGYTAKVKNELGEEMEVTFNGDIEIEVKPAA